MKIFYIDGKDFNNEYEFHLYMKEKFNFPDFYGKNLNALWDSFTDFLVECKEEGINKLKIIWNNFSLSKYNLKNNLTDILKIFNEDTKEKIYEDLERENKIGERYYPDFEIEFVD